MDIAVRTMRQLVKYYLRDGEKKEEFVGKAILLVRLFFEEGWRRAVLGCEGKLMRSAMCSMVVSIRAFEVDTLGNHACDLGVFLDLF